MSIEKRRIVYVILGEKEPVHLEIISTEKEINKLVRLLETTYKFSSFIVVPLRDDK